MISTGGQLLYLMVTNWKRRLMVVSLMRMKSNMGVGSVVGMVWRLEIAVS